MLRLMTKLQFIRFCHFNSFVTYQAQGPADVIHKGLSNYDGAVDYYEADHFHGQHERIGMRLAAFFESQFFNSKSISTNPFTTAYMTNPATFFTPVFSMSRCR